VPFAYLVALAQILHYRLPPRGLQNFFRSTSRNIVLSRVSSATRLFRRTFSSCTCFSWRTWSTSRPT
jgi:hypothetical protein